MTDFLEILGGALLGLLVVTFVILLEYSVTGHDNWVIRMTEECREEYNLPYTETCELQFVPSVTKAIPNPTYP